MIKLSDLVTIVTGVMTKSYNKSVPGGVRVVQMKDLNIHNEINVDQLATIELKSFPNSHLLQEGDILFRSRGITNTSVCFRGGAEAILAAPMLRLEVIGDTVTPEYISWFINQPQTQHWLSSRAEGTSVKMIGKKTLADLPVPVPARETQDKIVALHALSMREQSLLTEIKQKRKKQISGILGQIAQRGHIM